MRDSSPNAIKMSTAEKRMLELINRERKYAGLHPLKADLRLARAARDKCTDMIKMNYFGHNSPTYGNANKQLKALNLQGFSFLGGENIVACANLENAHQRSMNHFPTQSNILDPFYTHIGIGVVEGGPCGLIISQIFAG